MKTIVAAVLNGALVFATAAGFLALGAGAPAQGTLVAAYAVSVALAAVSAFFSIGGREAWLAHRALDISFCAALAVMWTGALVAFALILISSLLPADWLSADTAKAWLLAGTAAQAVLLAILARPQARLQGRDLELK